MLLERSMGGDVADVFNSECELLWEAF